MSEDIEWCIKSMYYRIINIVPYKYRINRDRKKSGASCCLGALVLMFVESCLL